MYFVVGTNTSSAKKFIDIASCLVGHEAACLPGAIRKYQNIFSHVDSRNQLWFAPMVWFAAIRITDAFNMRGVTGIQFPRPIDSLALRWKNVAGAL